MMRHAVRNAILLLMTLSCFSASNSMFNTIDPHASLYKMAIFRMDSSSRMSLPIMSDSEFMKYLTNDASIDDIDVVARSDSAIFDDKLDALLISQRAIDKKWEELMVAGPLVVNYMGNLMVLSSVQDFAFTLPSSNYVYQFIHHPSSFRATLAQLSHELSRALLNAHTGMDRIQTFVAQIPEHLNTTIKLMTRASPNMIKALLPNTLASIVRISDVCVTAANSTVEQFGNLQNLIEEIIRVTVSSQTANSDLIAELQQQISNTTIEVQLLTANVTSIKEQYEAKRLALEKAREEYWKAVNGISRRLVRKKWYKKITSAAWNVISAPVNAIGSLFSSSSSSTSVVVSQANNNLAFENAMAILKLKLDELKRAEAEHDEWFQKQLGDQYKLAALIQQLTSLNLGTVQPSQIIDILKRAFLEIQNLKVQWSQIHRFFLSVSLQADSTKELIGSRFVTIIEEALAANVGLQDEDREFFVELILIAAEEIDQNSELLYIMAKTYYDISSMHMMPQIAGIGRLLALDNNADRRQALADLQNDTLVTSTKVINMVQERQLTYKLRLHNRQTQLEDYLINSTLAELQSSIG